MGVEMDDVDRLIFREGGDNREFLRRGRDDGLASSMFVRGIRSDQQIGAEMPSRS
jgi:hypothetical protein